MANQISERINAPPKYEFRSFSQLAVEQLPAIIQDAVLSKGTQLSSELELTREPNIYRNNLCKTLYYLKNERIFFQGGGGDLEAACRLNFQDDFNYSWWKEQTIKTKKKFLGINTNIIEWFHIHFTLPIQSIYQYFAQEIKLTKGHVNSLLLRLSTDINLA